jgi:hypothetical protein
VLASAALALVWLGKGVRIGGHDASNQTLAKQKRGAYHVYDTDPKKPRLHIAQEQEAEQDQNLSFEDKK